MIVLKNHFQGKDTVIYSNVVSNGCQTFFIDELDNVCQRFGVNYQTKQEVLDAVGKKCRSR